MTRVTENEIRAYFNACLHRGTKLRASGTEGSASDFKCSFHGWSWNIDGTNKEIVCPWDFPHVDPEGVLRCRRHGSKRWAASCGSTWTRTRRPWREYLGAEALRHFKAWKLEDRYVVCHVVKPHSVQLEAQRWRRSWRPITCIATHPQVAAVERRRQSQYDIYGDHVNRFISPLGVVSPHLDGKYSEQDVLDQFTVGDCLRSAMTKPT